MKVGIRLSDGTWEHHEGEQVVVFSEDDSPLVCAIQRSPNSYVVAVAGESDFASVMSLFPFPEVREITRLEMQRQPKA